MADDHGTPPPLMRRQEVIALLVLLGVTFAAAGVGSLATASAVDGWYQTIEKPSWTPPSWLFGPVWTLLYAMMAVAAWRVWRKVGVHRPLDIYGVQLVLNAAWSLLFFGAKRPDLALVDILLLIAAVVWTIVWFRRVDPLAAWLLVPYLAWVCFATALNASIWWLGR